MTERCKMAPSDMADRLIAIEADNARLRLLLDDAGATDGLRHGLRDTVAMLRTIMRRSSETVDDVESYVAHLEGRLDAIMRIRTRLEVFGEADLHTVVSDELLFHLVREGEQAVIEGPSVCLRPKAAQSLALAVHELTSNGVEHGPLARPEGSVEVLWRIEPSERGSVLSLLWREMGCVNLGTPTHRGFGTSVLEEMIVYDLKAQASMLYEAEGLSYAIRFPLTEQVGRWVEEPRT